MNTQDTTLPLMPEPKATGLGDEYESFDREGKPMGKAYANIEYFTADQMHAYARAAIAAPQAERSEDTAALRRDLAKAHDSANGFVEEIQRLKQLVRELGAFRAMVNRYQPEFPADVDGPRDVWYWQGDHMDHLESMVHTLPVVIRAEQLRELLATCSPKAPGGRLIETAPKESGLYLVLIGDQAHISQYNLNTMTPWWRPYGIPAPLATNPSHWMPLPAAPGLDAAAKSAGELTPAHHSSSSATHPGLCALDDAAPDGGVARDRLPIGVPPAGLEHSDFVPAQDHQSVGGHGVGSHGVCGGLEGQRPDDGGVAQGVSE